MCLLFLLLRMCFLLHLYMAAFFLPREAFVTTCIRNPHFLLHIISFCLPHVSLFIYICVYKLTSVRFSRAKGLSVRVPAESVAFLLNTCLMTEGCLSYRCGTKFSVVMTSQKIQGEPIEKCMILWRVQKESSKQGSFSL